MRNFPERVQIALALLVIGVAVVVGALTSYYNLHTMEAELGVKLENQRTVLFSIAEIVDKNGADSTVKSLINDCSRRTEFETMLANLASLGHKDLITLQSLIENCGNYYPSTKAIMVAKMEREFLAYEELIELMKILNTDNLDTYEVAAWTELIELEKKRSELLGEQVQIQSAIVQLLIQKNSPQSTAVQTQAQDAQRINILLGTHNTRIDEIRSTLTR